MAILDNAARVEVWADLMRQLSNDGETIGVTKPELRAVINDLDAFMDAHASDINAAIPQPARGALTVQQKALILSYVVLKRYKVI